MIRNFILFNTEEPHLSWTDDVVSFSEESNIRGSLKYEVGSLRMIPTEGIPPIFPGSSFGQMDAYLNNNAYIWGTGSLLARLKSFDFEQIVSLGEPWAIFFIS